MPCSSRVVCGVGTRVKKNEIVVQMVKRFYIAREEPERKKDRIQSSVKCMILNMWIEHVAFGCRCKGRTFTSVDLMRKPVGGISIFHMTSSVSGQYEANPSL